MKRIVLIIVCLCSLAIAQNKPYRILNSFNAGELSPLLNAREDLAKYQSGLSVMENMIPLPQGAAQKRPGTIYVAESKENTKIRMLPFEYSIDESYAIEAGNQYFRFFTDNAVVLAGVGTEDISSLDNIIAHWLLNELSGTVVLDDDGGTHNGTASVDCGTLTATGKVGTGCFDLDSQYTVEMADHGDFSFTDDADDTAFSIVCWTYVTGQGDLQTILSKWRDDNATREWRFSLNADRKPQLHLADTSADLTANRVAQWYLNDDAATTHVDDVSTNHDGVATSNTDTFNATGKISGALDFGAAEAVEINDNAALSFDDSGTNPFSIAAWIYVTDTAGDQKILTKYDSGSKGEWEFSLNALEEMYLHLRDESAGKYVFRKTDDALSIGWHFVIVTYDSTGGATAGTGITFYVDGLLADSTVDHQDAGYVAMEDLASKVAIGGNYAAGALQKSFADKMDNVILFNIELTTANVSALWNDGVGTESMGVAMVSAVADTALTIGWHNLACSYSAPADETAAADGIILYVDGAAVSSTATNDASYTAMQGGAEEIRIGSQRNTGDSANENFWADQIDEISIYGDVLTSTEIASLYSTTPYEVTTPYLTADLFELKYEQSADVLYILHPDYETRKLSRLANANWTLTALGIQNGPFRDQNTTITATIAASATTGSVTLTATGCTPFVSGTTSGHLPDGAINTSKSQTGALFKIVHPLGTLEYSDELDDNYTDDQTENVSWLDCGTVYEGTTWYLTTLGTWIGTLEIQRNYTIGAAHGAAGWEKVFAFASTDDRNVATEGTQDTGDASYRAILIESGDGAEQCKVYFRTDQTEHIGIVEITAVASTTSATATVLTTLASTDATHKWSEGSWSNYRGWPRAATFFEDRLTFGGNDSQPDTIWASVTADYENMTEGADDDDALIFTLSSRQVNIINWLIGKDKILIGTSGAEWTLGGSSDEPLTPSNVKAEQHSTYGSADLQAVLASESVLFFQRGSEKMRELAYNWETDAYVAPDMTLLVPEVTGDGITDVAYQQTPNSILWCVRDDGEMAIFVYERAELITSWSRLITDGAFESVAVITGDPEDEVWVSVNRTIGGSTVRYIEYFSARDFGSDVDDAFFVDSGVTYDSTATTTITGLDHLNAETVAVLGDGTIQTDQTVSGGQISITSASTVQAGLPFTVQMKTMSLNYFGAGSTIQGRIKRINEVIARYYNSGDFDIGKDVSTKNTLSISSMATGEERMTFPAGYDRPGYVFVYQQSPEPLTLVALMLEFMVY